MHDEDVKDEEKTLWLSMVEEEKAISDLNTMQNMTKPKKRKESCIIDCYR